jgi:hypothetical protein
MPKLLDELLVGPGANGSEGGPVNWVDGYQKCRECPYFYDPPEVRTEAVF